MRILSFILMSLISLSAWATPLGSRPPLLWATAAHSQFFGKNKVTEKRFKWLLHRTDHFDIYYYPSEAALVPEVGEIIERAYQRLSDALNHELEGRTPIILYKSHTDFRQTNVTLEELTEGIGGFAELFKHRVVIPFTGSRRDLREVLFHELTHIFQYDIIYQKPIAHIYTGEFLYSPPIWFIEGMAEYFGGEMDSIGEMVLRTAVVTNGIVPLTRLHDFSVLGRQVYLGYKEGQSAVTFLARRYGEDKIASILQELKHNRTKNLNEAMKNAIGVSLEEFDRQWQRDLKKRYYPLVSERDMPDAFARQLTRARDGGYLKFDWSPSGDLVACITTEGGRYDLAVMSASTGKVMMRPISHLYRNQFEEIQSRGNGIAWSPDGDRLAFFARKENQENLFIYNLIAGDLKRITMPFDSCWSPEWSPDGGRIAFVALKDGRSDIYLLSLRRLQVDRLSITRVTDDIYDEGGISWNPNSDQILYSSERAGWHRIVLRDLLSGDERILTPPGFNSVSPRWTSDGGGVIFVSDMTGFNDIYRMEVSTGETVRLVKSITGCFSPAISPDGETLAFVAYHDGKQDIFTVRLSSLSPEATTLTGTSPAEASEGKATEVIVGRRRYRPKLMLDAIFTDFAMSSDGILRNITQLVASDMMGNHRVMLTVMGQSGYFAPDFIAYYFYLGMRPDFGVALYNYHTVHLVRGIWGDEWYLERNTGAAALLSYPFSRYRRVDLQLETVSMPFTYNFWTSRPISRGNITYLSAYLIGDTVTWSELGPKGGGRYAVGLEKALPQLGSALDVTNLILDARRYLALGRRSILAFRVMGAASFGLDNMIYYLGGIDTLRGYRYEELSGSRMFLLNLELRVPFIDEIRFGWPLPWALRGIRGIGFMDVGTAWWPEDEPVFWRLKGKKVELVDLASSVGVGLRLSLGIFDLNMDFAWRTNLSHIEPGPVFHFGLGQEF
jgi:hypothetical protein